MVVGILIRGRMVLTAKHRPLMALLWTEGAPIPAPAPASDNPADPKSAADKTGTTTATTGTMPTTATTSMSYGTSKR